MMADPDAIQRWHDEIDDLFARMQTRAWAAAAARAFELPLCVTLSDVHRPAPRSEPDQYNSAE